MVGFVAAPMLFAPLSSLNNVGRKHRTVNLHIRGSRYRMISPTLRCSEPQQLESQNMFSHPAIAPTECSDVQHFTHLGEESSDNADVATMYGGGDGQNTNGRGGGGRYSRDPGDDGGRGDSHLPEDARLALASGILTQEALTRYYQSLKNPFTRLLLNIPAFRTRFLADPAFLFKLWAQELIGNGTALASEIAVRGKDIMHELEYVASDLIVGTVVEAAFVWLLAPTLVLPTSAKSGLSRYLSSLPANIFQPSSAVQSFTLSQRFVSFFYAGAQYALIGFAAGIVGTAITYSLIEGRKLIDKSYKPERPLPAVLPNSVAWGAFMALSSNTRFQIVEGMELGIARLFAKRSPSIVNGGIITLRFANNYWGGVQFVQFFRFLGLHATGEESEHSE